MRDITKLSGLFSFIFLFLTCMGIWFIQFDFFAGMNYLLWGLSPIIFFSCCCFSIWNYLQYNQTKQITILPS